MEKETQDLVRLALFGIAVGAYVWFIRSMAQGSRRTDAALLELIDAEILKVREERERGRPATDA
jgi:hypothetical protein